jgi:integrase
MARKIRDASLESRTARERLRPRGKPYYSKPIAQDLSLGYRKPKRGAGRWQARLYAGDGEYRFEMLDGCADDLTDANGRDVLDFWQAVERARTWRDSLNQPEPEITLTVAAVVQAYMADRDARDSKRKGRAVNSDAGQRLRRYVLGQPPRGKQKAIEAAPLASVPFAALTENDLRSWRVDLPDTVKAATKQRLINDLKAALNAGYDTHRAKLANPNLPGTIKHGLKAPQRDDDSEAIARDNQILTDAQIGQLLQAAREIDAEEQWEGDLFRIVLVLAATGARFSQIARMRVRDCQLAEKRLLVPVSRKGKGKSGFVPVPVGIDVLDALRPVVIGRPGDAWLLERWRVKQVSATKWERIGRGPWQAASELARPWTAIRERAELPDAIPYALRHSSIVRGIRQNLPIRLVAALHDTSVAMVERHYAKWITSGLEDMVRAALTTLLPPPSGDNVVPLKGARTDA